MNEKRQYTGERDKKDKKIYTGDIVKIGNDNLMVYLDKENSMYSLKLTPNIYMGTLASNGRESVEIIGNVYKNPELLIEF